MFKRSDSNNIISSLITSAVGGVIGSYGTFKKISASKILDEANKIGEEAQSKYQAAQEKLFSNHQLTQQQFETLSLIKQQIFHNQIAHFLNTLKNSGKFQKVSGELKDFDVNLFLEDLTEIQDFIQYQKNSNHNVQSTSLGTLLGAIAYSGFKKKAPEGWLSQNWESLTGAKSKRKTHNFFIGAAATTFSAGVALAWSGFKEASDAEKALTEAQAFAAQVEVEIGRFEILEKGFIALQDNIQEIINTLNELVNRYETVKVNATDDKNFELMANIAVALKNIMMIKIVQENGELISNIKQTCSGYLTQEI
jgi:hypothetical protein